ncbi:NAD(P)-dependent dehydrogenase (short-subunit alcohol dehydrogenase family) [Microbacterium halimionae]|uniref:NAD(P)-dependent dehydrogenase (Short-subunit alcohol dehydrogenase family) n=1 Tax=Microbacterium halimionae TaxID=1526413 RepID=A0A7W3PM95_9MICO|nr:hypothetical protein [Microbacterium halimionae]MBA8816973.1 NAD(P)-dependent dehydrogenase (short-subunit alcohol dehydrogenase family) [Microbacterium halimionae]NII94488.1 NAD(P)-dependent dehydrogenase (short-subunit alcohol dehydrogenase family) [Microbacterium halimionae]
MTTSYSGLIDHTVVVMGAAGGQGLAAAVLMAQSGARVIATDVAETAPVSSRST